MSTTRKKTPAARSAGKPRQRKGRKSSGKGRVILAPEVARMFATLEPVPVEEADIVAERSAFVAPAPATTALACRPVLALVAPVRATASRARFGTGWRVAALALVVIAATAASWARLRPRATPAVAAVATPRPIVAPPPARPSLLERLRTFGHEAFSAGEKIAALRSYERVLAFDRGAVDARMVANLLACYGQRRTQPAAAALIVRFQIVDARAGLLALLKEGKTRGTRLGARYTLEKLRGDRPTHLS